MKTLLAIVAVFLACSACHAFGVNTLMGFSYDLVPPCYVYDGTMKYISATVTIENNGGTGGWVAIEGRELDHLEDGMGNTVANPFYMNANEAERHITLCLDELARGVLNFQAVESPNRVIQSDLQQMTIVGISVKYVNIDDEGIFDNTKAPGTDTYYDNDPINPFPMNEYENDEEELSPLCLRADQFITANVALVLGPSVNSMRLHLVVEIEDNGNRLYSADFNGLVEIFDIVSGTAILPPFNFDDQVEAKIRNGTYNIHIRVGDYNEPVGLDLLSRFGGSYYVVGQLPGGSIMTLKRLDMLTSTCNDMLCELVNAYDSRDIMEQLWNMQIVQIPVEHVDLLVNRDDPYGNVVWEVLDGQFANAEDIIYCFKHMIELLGIYQGGIEQADKYLFFDLSSLPFKDSPINAFGASRDCLTHGFECWGFQSQLWAGTYARIPILEWSYNFENPIYLVPQCPAWMTSIQDIADTVAGNPPQCGWLYRGNNIGPAYIWEWCENQ